MKNNFDEQFQKWLNDYCLYVQNKSIKKIELEEIYSRIDLFDAKLAFLDGESIEEFKPFIKY